MRNYDRVNPRKPEGIEGRHAYIVGGGIAGLSAAAFLVRDAQMPGENITIYDQLPVFGGSMDACGNAETGYVARGERELEPYMECLWDLFSTIPSLYEEGRSVLDETRECNRDWEINSVHRLWERGFVPHDESDMGLTPVVRQQMIMMFTTPEEELEYVTIEQWFDASFFESNLWYYWSAMLAFQPYQSLIEMRRYAVRFMHQLHLIKSLKQILRTKYDQYHSLILPLQAYLKDHGVNFVSETTVTDMDLEIDGISKTVTALRMECNGKETCQPVGQNDMVFFTNGSMTQNSTRGSMTEAPIMNTDTRKRGCFTLWEKLAAKSDDFGHPERFTFDPIATNFVSATITIKDYPQLFDYIAEKTGNPTGKAGVTTFVHSPWYISHSAALQPIEPNQPENVQVLWIYGLHANNCGEYVDKRMIDCNGEEILQELLYWYGLEDRYDEIREHCTVIPTVMPYITSQFMPRSQKDRPEIIPEGSQNLAFIGQFVELPGDVVFTVETSIRTAMTAVYRMTHLDRPVDPLFEGQYDIRMVKAGLLTMTGKDKIEMSDLPKIDPFKLPKMMKQILDGINQIPEVPAAYSELWENR
ncbi:MAG: oleate hydratase [Eggerthellaceae bacterium]